MVEIRPAHPDDAEVAAVLLSSAYTHTQLSFPLADTPERGWLDRLQLLFRQSANRFSYENIAVSMEHGAVVGLVLSFGGRDEVRLNAAVGSWLEREALDDEWYADALAVLQPWGGLGIGSALLRHAEQAARAQGYAKVALHVAEENEVALGLYTHRGYVITRRTALYGRPYVRMVKSLGDA